MSLLLIDYKFLLQLFPVTDDLQLYFPAVSLMQISYNYMLPFEDIPDDLVPLTAHLKELLNCATPQMVS